MFLQKITIVTRKLTLCLLLSVIGMQPVMAWQPASGSLAINKDDFRQFGIVYDQVNFFISGKGALYTCGQGCEVVLDFDDCAVYVTDSKFRVATWAEALTANAAASRALSSCAAKGGKNCEVQVYACNSLEQY